VTDDGGKMPFHNYIKGAGYAGLEEYSVPNYVKKYIYEEMANIANSLYYKYYENMNQYKFFVINGNETSMLEFGGLVKLGKKPTDMKKMYQETDILPFNANAANTKISEI
jgi:hypothetical protein